MRIIEVDARKGRRKRDIIIVSLSEEDIEAMRGQDSAMQGEFKRGMVLMCLEDKLEDMLEILRGI